MATTETLQRGCWSLRCTAKVMPDGTFRPDVVVAGREWPSRPHGLPVEGGNFLLEPDAMDAARVAGLAWVTDRLAAR